MAAQIVAINICNRMPMITIPVPPVYASLPNSALEIYLNTIAGLLPPELIMNWIDAALPSKIPATNPAIRMVDIGDFFV